MQKLCVFFYDTGKLVEYALTDLSGPYMDLQHLQLSGLLAGNRKMETSVGDIEHILLTHPEAGTLSSHICSFLDINKVLYEVEQNGLFEICSNRGIQRERSP